MAGIIVYVLEKDGEFNKNSLGAISEAAKLAGQIGGEATALVVGDVPDDKLATLGSYGASKVFKVNGPAGLAHLHRLRALVDAVVVGIGTALADDPQLTVRHVVGPNPARIVIDPRGRIPACARLLARDGWRRTDGRGIASFRQHRRRAVGAPVRGPRARLRAACPVRA